MKIRFSRSELFARHVGPPDANGCRLWTGAVYQSTGYGQSWIGANRSAPAHRVAWMLAHGPISPGLCVCHRCDVKLCVEPSHLFLGTQAENVADAVRKGRMKPPEPRPGSLHASAKLTESTSAMIRTAAERGETQRAIAARFGVSQRLVWSVIHRVAWRHVT